ncbi:hypothetical protein EDF43_106260 [Rathayibacter sp. PhB179]|nr:hypothetical protein EDF49_106260 [Rathayibacter sp. PhB192]TCM27466.1 hypothetical protein EDF43_106260 [Rathayibacter sp. PhB179]
MRALLDQQEGGPLDERPPTLPGGHPPLQVEQPPLAPPMLVE